MRQPQSAYIAEINFHRGAYQFNEAMEAARRYTEDYPQDIEAWLWLRNTSISANNPEVNEYAVKQLLNEFPAEARALHYAGHNVGYLYNFGGNHSELEALQDDLLRRAALIPQPHHYTMGAVRWMQREITRGNYIFGSTAETLLRDVRARRDYTGAMAMRLANAFSGIGDFTHAIELLEESKAKQPDMATMVEIEALRLIAQNGDVASLIPVLKTLEVPSAIRTAIETAEILAAPLPPNDDRVTTAIVTNLSRKLVTHRNIAPPKTGLIEATWNSYKAHMQPAEGWPVKIYYDYPAEDSDDARTYKTALEELCARIGAELIVLPHFGLRRVYEQIIADTTTGFLFFLEHDWVFEPHCPTLTQLVAVMQAHPARIHSIRMNKRESLPNGLDQTMIRDLQIQDTPLLKTLTFSNNPNLFRLNKLKRDLSQFWKSGHGDAINGGAGSNEVLVTGAFNSLAAHLGPTLAHRVTGQYIYGHYGDTPRVVHWGY